MVEFIELTYLMIPETCLLPRYLEHFRQKRLVVPISRSVFAAERS